MGVLLIGAGAVVAHCDIGQARTRDFLQTTDNGSEALPARTVTGTLIGTISGTISGAEQGVASETSPGPILRLATPRPQPGPPASRPPQVDNPPAHQQSDQPTRQDQPVQQPRQEEGEQRRQPQPAETGTPSTQPPPSAPPQQTGQPPQAADRRQDAQSAQPHSPAQRQPRPPRMDGQDREQARSGAQPVNQGVPLAHTPPHTQARSQGQQDTQRRQAQNEQEDSVRRRAQSEQEELARRTGREPAATQPVRVQDRERQGTLGTQGQANQDRQGNNQDRQGNNQDRQGNQDREGNQDRQGNQESQANQDREGNQENQDHQGDRGSALPNPSALTSGTAQFDGAPMMRVGAPADRDSAEPASGSSAQGTKATARDGGGNRFANLRLAPPPESYRPSELLVANASLVLL